jgi:hypothetical protein
LQQRRTLKKQTKKFSFEDSMAKIPSRKNSPRRMEQIAYPIKREKEQCFNIEKIWKKVIALL